MIHDLNLEMILKSRIVFYVLIFTAGCIVLFPARASFELCSRHDWRVCRKKYDYFVFQNWKACIYYGRNSGSYNRADFTCIKAQGNLPEIISQDDQDNIFGIISQRGEEGYWLRFYFHPVSKAFRWRSNLESALTFENWAIGSMSRSGYCAMINATDGLWYRTRCSSNFTTMCFSKVLDPAERPNLTVHMDKEPNKVRAGNPVRADCVAAVGNDSTLTWLLIVGGVEEFISGHNDTRVSNTEEFQMMDGVCRRIMRSSVELNVSVTRTILDLPSLTLSCASHRASEQLKNCFEGGAFCEDQHISILYANSKPTLVPLYHSKSRPVAHVFRSLLVNCTTCIDGMGNVTFYEGYLGGSIAVAPNDSRIVYESTLEKECGTQMSAILSVYITWDTMGSSVSCLSYQELHGHRINHVQSSWAIIQVDEGPQMPMMEVNFHGEPSVAIVSRILHANCSACAGSEGEITWSVKDRHNVTWPLRDLPGIKVLDMTIHQNPNEKCTKDMVNVMTLIVSPALQGCRLVCASFNGTYLGFLELVVESLPIKVVSLKEEETTFEFSGVFMFLLLLLLLILLLVALREYMGAEEHQETHKGRVALKSRTFVGHKGPLIDPRKAQALALQRKKFASMSSGASTESTCVDTGLPSSKQNAKPKGDDQIQLSLAGRKRRMMREVNKLKNASPSASIHSTTSRKSHPSIVTRPSLLSKASENSQRSVPSSSTPHQASKAGSLASTVTPRRISLGTVHEVQLRRLRSRQAVAGKQPQQQQQPQHHQQQQEQQKPGGGSKATAQAGAAAGADKHVTILEKAQAAQVQGAGPTPGGRGRGQGYVRTSSESSGVPKTHEQRKPSS